MPDDAYENLPPNIAEALERAETKYREALNPANPYEHLPLLSSARILGAGFSAYENRDRSLPEDLAQSPILLHSSNARFHQLTRFVSIQWLSDFETFAEKVIELESMRRAKQPVSEAAESDLLTFGLQIADEAYIVGFTGPDTAVITNKELVLRLLLLAADAFVILSGRITVGFQALPLKLRLEALLTPGGPGQRS